MSALRNAGLSCLKFLPFIREMRVTAPDSFDPIYALTVWQRWHIICYTLNAGGGFKMGTTKTATARALLDPKVKEEAEEILKRLGLSVSKSFELFYLHQLFLV